MRLEYIRNFLLFLFAVYYAQGSIYPSGSLISQLCILVILLISCVYFIYALMSENFNCLFFNVWTIMVFMNVTGFILTADFSDNDQIDVFKNILGCMLPFYPFYYFAKRNKLKEKHLVIFFIIILPLYFLQFFKFRKEIMILTDSDDPTTVINNIAYLFVSLIPFILLIKKNKLIAAALMAIMIMVIIQSAKRGAIITGIIGLIMFFYSLFKSINNQNKLRGYIIVIVVIALLSVFAYESYMSNEFLKYRISNLSEGNVSNRDIIYGKIFNTWYNSENGLNFLFGFGFVASRDIAGSFAHSDWFELLSNFGLFGICVYLLLFYSAFKLIFKKEFTIDKKILMLTITLIWFFVTIFSMWYTQLAWYSQSIMLAFLFGSRVEAIE